MNERGIETKYNRPDELIGAYLTSVVSGVGGRIKSSPDDFVVEEIPAYSPKGEGEHLFLKARKRGMSTPTLIRIICKKFKAREFQIGYAGLKDRDATTTQWISVHLPVRDRREIAARAVDELNAENENFSILESAFHTNKLKLGHLKGNRFVIKAVDLAVPSLEARRLCDAIKRELSERGVPNYFGAQRFGAARNGHTACMAFMRGDYQTAFELLYPFMRDGSPSDGRQADLYKLFVKKNWRKLISETPQAMLRVVASAYQSRLFNLFLSERAGEIDRIYAGQWAQKNDSGAKFISDDEAADNERCRAKAISPTGPIYGPDMRWSSGAAGEAERELYLSQPAPMESLRNPVGGVHLPGERRVMRFFADPIQIDFDDAENSASFAFSLPSGCYATVLLREFMKNEEAESAPLPE